MRLRHIKDAKEQLLEFKNLYIDDCESMHGKWRWLFNNNHALYLEIGCGKGQFIINQALKNPDINFIALERDSTILLKALKKTQKIIDTGYVINNLKFTNGDANKLEFTFDDNELDKIFLNFSDPWPKKRQAKRRLTNISFLKQYYLTLKPNSVVELKTDNDNLYLYSLEQLQEDKNQFEIIYQTTDLYKELSNPLNIDNIATEYENRFVALNKNINKIIFKSLKQY